MEKITLTAENMRFISKVSVMPSGCWVFGGAQSQAYGTLKVKGRPVKAHRYSYELAYKQSAEGLFVCHHCDNPRCVNPNHLFLGTAKDNTRDCWKKGRNHNPKLNRQARGSETGPAKYPERYRGKNNGRAVLTEPEVRQIIQRLRQKESQVSIATFFNVAPSTISAIANKRNWRECWSSLGDAPTCEYRRVL
jgi:HNH endonuclease/CENP-B N-terminal DNA-binding domain